MINTIKKLTLAAALLTLSAAVNAQDLTALQVKGTVPGGASGYVYLQKFDNKNFNTVDSVRIENNKFEFRTPVQLPELYGITLKRDQLPLYVFLDKGPIQVQLDSADYYRNSVVSGSALQDQFTSFKKEKDVKISDYIKAHPKSLVTAYLLYRNYAYRLTAAEIEANVKLLDPSLANTPYVVFLKEFTGVLNKVAVGKKAADFSAKSPEGQTISLSGIYTKHKYTLVDFWASWCQPCRKENPNVVAAFEQFKGKGFTVFGVSLDKNSESWVQAIKADHLNWPQISELSYWNSIIAKDYGVRAIPANFLVDENGIIVARNLRGEELPKKLAELLK